MSDRRSRVLAPAVAVAILALLAGWGGVAAAELPGGPRGPASPANDLWEDAEPVGTLPATKTADTTNATTETGEPSSSCNGNSATVWYRITLASDRVILVDTFGSDIDTGISVWRGPSLEQLTEVACSYGSERDGHDQPAGRVAFRGRAGIAYYLQVDSQEGSPIGGPITLHVDKVTPPANDQFGDAEAVTLPFHTMVSNARATTQPGEPAFGPCLPMRATVWYRIRPATDMVIRADTLGTEHDTVLAVFAGGPSLAQLTYRHCDDDTAVGTFSHQSLVSWRATAGTTYWLQVGGQHNETGLVDLTIRRVTPPPNDQRAAATVISTLPFGATPDNRHATQQPGENVFACDGNPFFQSVWYRYTPASAAPLRAAVDGAPGTSPMVAVFTGSSFATDVEVGCVVNGVLDFTPVPGTTYFFLVAGQEGRAGSLEFQLLLSP